MGRKVVFLILFILTFSCLGCTCFATGNLTTNDFRELLIDNNININSDTEIPSDVTTILNQYPIIIKSSDNSKVYIFGTPFDVTSQNSFTKVIIAPYTENNVLAYSLGITNGTNYFTYKNNIQENIYTSSLSRKRVIFDVETQTFSISQYFYFNKASSPNSRDFSNSPTNGTFGLIYNSEDYTVENFKNISTLKKYLNNNLLFNGVEKIIFPGGINIFYKFDGVFKGNGTQEPYTSSFTANNTALKFEYTAYTDLTNSKVVNYFYLQEFTPSEAVNLTDEDLNFTDSDEQIVINEKLESNFSYTSMIRKMQQGYIYRLYCFSNQHNESGDLIRTTDSTSCFFSLNSWNSNSITVLNIYELLFPENPDIEQEGGTSGGVIDLENIQNGVNDINNFLNEDISSTSSGDLENALNVNVDIDDPTADFFTWFFNQIVDCFTVDSNQVLTFTILEKEFKINSDDYILDIPVLQNVIGIGSSIFIFYGIFQDIRREIEKIKEGKFEEIANEDISANMM